MRFEHFVIRPSRSRARNDDIAGWSSLEARRAHNPEAVGSNPTPATTKEHAIVHVLFLLTTRRSERERSIHIKLANIVDFTRRSLFLFRICSKK